MKLSLAWLLLVEQHVLLLSLTNTGSLAGLLLLLLPAAELVLCSALAAADFAKPCNLASAKSKA
jgi:hypothetical protein